MIQSLRAIRHLKRPIARVRAIEALPANEVHLWLLADSGREAWPLIAALRLTSPGERQAARRFVFARHRRQYLLTRALVRRVLSRYAAMAPTDWRFARNHHGKPFIAGDRGARPRLHFNVSHTAGLIVCAVSRAGEVGVDTENWERQGTLTAVADQYMTPTELVALARLPPDQRPGRLADSWSVKEAYVKACGLGLSLPLTDCRLAPAPDGSGMRIDIPSAPTHWHFWLLRHAAGSARYSIAVALHHDRPPLASRLVVRQDSGQQDIACSAVDVMHGAVTLRLGCGTEK